jgi:presenilin 1
MMRGESLPALIYTSGVFGRPGLEDVDSASSADDDTNETVTELGLGDFWFYGILLTRAARVGWDVAILCLLAVVLGLALTLFAFDWTGQPMPALPVSLALGMAAFPVAVVAFRPFLDCIRAAGIVF